MRCGGFNHQIAAKRSFAALARPLPVPSIRGRAVPQMRRNGLDRVRIGDICDHSQGAAAQRADRNTDIKYTLKPLGPAQWRAMQCLIDSGFSGGQYCRFV
jgi:hypothetical protein